ncbi:MAG: MXAN_2562 family outer membrane beta-barrel protein [Myxococcota bacterium]|nr:MXAN_2562 family outer membrane beta-barrel protein [Myxococcota bacterium]
MRASLVCIALAMMALVPQTGLASELAASHIELKFGTYAPKISDDQTKSDFYDLMYGADNEPLMTSFAAHWYPWRQWGLLGGGFRLSMWKIDGQARLCSNGDEFADCDSTTVFDSTEGNSTTQITALPISLEAVYRIDVLHRNYGIPFEAFVKVGLDYHLWWASTEGEIAERTVDGETTRGEGGTAGYHVSAGLMMSLNWLDPKTAARGRVSSSMAGSYLFIEWTKLQANGFGEDNRLDMSDDQLYVGLAVDFL